PGFDAGAADDLLHQLREIANLDALRGLDVEPMHHDARTLDARAVGSVAVPGHCRMLHVCAHWPSPFEIRFAVPQRVTREAHRRRPASSRHAVPLTEWVRQLAARASSCRALCATIRSASSAARCPLATALSMVAGKPVAVQSPARKKLSNGVTASGRSRAA